MSETKIDCTALECMPEAAVSVAGPALWVSSLPGAPHVEVALDRMHVLLGSLTGSPMDDTMSDDETILCSECLRLSFADMA